MLPSLANLPVPNLNSINPFGNTNTNNNMSQQQAKPEAVYQNFYGVTIRLNSAENLVAADVNGKSDPYVVFEIDGKSKRKSKVVSSTLNPEFNQTFSFIFEKQPKVLKLTVKDKDVVSKSDFLGEAQLNLDGFFKSQVQPAFNDSVKLSKVKKGTVNLSVECTLVPRLVGQQEQVEFDLDNLTSFIDLQIVEAANLQSQDVFSKSDPYAIVSFGLQSYRTPVKPNDNNPKFDLFAPFWVATGQDNHVMKISVRDDDVFQQSEFSGNIFLRPNMIPLGQSLDVWLPLVSDDPSTDAQLSDLLQRLQLDLPTAPSTKPAASADVIGHVHLRLTHKSRQDVEAEFFDGLFTVYDQDNNNKMEEGEFIHMVQTLGCKLSDDDISNVFAAHDGGNKGYLNKEEFVKLISAAVKSTGGIGSMLSSVLGSKNLLSLDKETVQRLYLSMRHGKDAINRLLTGREEDVDNDNTKILVQDRETGMVVAENIPTYIKSAMRVMYRSFTGRTLIQSDKVNATLKSMTVKQGVKMTSPDSKKEIPAFIQTHSLNVNEVERPLEEYATFNEFFYRRLKAGARICAQPDNPRVAVSPADSRMMVFETIEQSQELWIKGQNFNLGNLFAKWDHDGTMAGQFNGGSLVIARLAPQDYHRWHFPVDGTPLPRYMIEGNYLTVNPIAIRKVDVYTENKRCICPIETKEFGLVVLIAVAATMVGSMNFVVDPKAKSVKKFDEHGYFAFGGSTVLLLFRPGTIVFDADLLKNSKNRLETLVKVGASLGTATGKIPPARQPSKRPIEDPQLQNDQASSGSCFPFCGK